MFDSAKSNFRSLILADAGKSALNGIILGQVYYFGVGLTYHGQAGEMEDVGLSCSRIHEASTPQRIFTKTLPNQFPETLEDRLPRMHPYTRLTVVGAHDRQARTPVRRVRFQRGQKRIDCALLGRTQGKNTAQVSINFDTD